MDKSLLGHMGLALASTVTAYVAWQAPNITDKDDSVVVFGDKADNLTAVEWTDETGVVKINREGEALTITTAKIAPAPTAPATPQTYPASEAASDLLKKLAPLSAARDLGKPELVKIQELGLEKPKSKLVLSFGEVQRSLDVGNNAFGSGDYYARTQDGQTYLVRAATLSALGHGAIALQDKDAVGLPRKKFDTVRIATGGKQREIKQRNGEDSNKAFFSDPAEPDHRLDSLSGWMDRVLRLRVFELASDAPTGEPQLTVEFLSGKESVAQLRVWASGDKGALATSSHFKSPVMLPKGAIDAVLRDAESAMNDGRQTAASAP